MDSDKTIAPYGTWESPISTELISGSTNQFFEVHVDPKSESIYLIEGRPAESGRCAVVRFKGSESKDVLLSEYSVRSKVHEYGGGAASICPDGSLLFSDGNTSGVFSLSPSGAVHPVIEADEKLRYADFDTHPLDDKWILAVQEVHESDLPEEVVNRLVLIDTSAKSKEPIRSGADFYAQPRFSPDGKWISWIQWNHPDMPWTGSELYVAEWKHGKLGGPKLVAGKAGKESIGQPKWHSYGGLIFSSDKTGFYQLYMYDPASSEIRPIPVKGFEDADLSNAPGSNLGNSSYIELNPATLAVAYTRKVFNGVLLVGILSQHIVELPTAFIDVGNNALRRVSNTQFVVIAAVATAPRALYLIDLDKKDKMLLRSTTSIPLDPSIYSTPRSISFPRTRGANLVGLSHAIFTPPYNPSFSAPSDAKPPLIVSIHGGPTTNATPGLNLTTQYWTSRGYAYVHVNYAGSTGYGRAYQESLNYFWGIKDVDDAASCVDYLTQKGLVDGSKVGITGGSAGGYTVLQSLVVYPTLYAGGNSLYGIGNLKLLATGTHKFESHYLFALLFPPGTSKDEQEKIYSARSPVEHCSKIERPLLLLQGDNDMVVPLDQAIEMEQTLRDGGKDVRLVVFKGEGHGFRKQENLKTAIDEEEKLWRKSLLK